MEPRLPHVEHEHHQEWDYGMFKARIVDAFENSQLGVCAYEALPQRLSLGDPQTAPQSFAGRLFEAHGVMQTDGRERDTVIQYDPGKKVLQIRRELGIGDDAKVNHALEEAMSPAFVEAFARLSGAERARQQALLQTADPTLDGLQRPIYEDSELGQLLRRAIVRCAGLLHTHPNEASFSPQDVMNVLTLPDMKLSGLAFADTMTVLVTTADTTWLERAAADKQSARAIEQIDQRLDRFRTADVARNEQNRIQAVDAMVRTLAKRHKLGYYQGSLQSGTLQRVV